MSIKRMLFYVLPIAMIAVVSLSPSNVKAADPQSTTAAMGAGHFQTPALDVEYAFTAIKHKDGSVTGAFHHSSNDGLGTVEFDAKVTCMEVDVENGRAWIGGVITKNSSTSPDYLVDITQPGHDIWFRVLAADGDGVSRSTFVGFEGAIPSSEAYCASKPWPDNNARTWPVTQGHIFVR